MKERFIYTAIGLVPAIWLALLIAPSVSGGLPMIIEELPLVINNPLNITPCKDSLKTVLIFCAVYLLGVGIYFSTRRNYRRGVEHGSAKWGFANLINKKYADKSPTQNKLLMFDTLLNYADEDFYKQNPVIHFDTLSGYGEYEVLAVFKIDVATDPFFYTTYIDMDEEQFDEYLSEVRARAMYDTGVEAEFGDMLITLSTCEYTLGDGRFVVVGVKT